MIDQNCPYGAKNYESCYHVISGWRDFPPECNRCCEETERELNEQFGDPDIKDN